MTVYANHRCAVCGRQPITDEGVHVTPEIELCPPCAMRVYALLRQVYDAAPRAERGAAG